MYKHVDYAIADKAIENALNTAHRNAQKAAIAHGRWMFVCGFVLGALVSECVTALVGLR